MFDALKALSHAKEAGKAIEQGAEHLKEKAAPILAYEKEFVEHALPTLAIVLEHAFANAVKEGAIIQSRSDEFFALVKKGEELAPEVEHVAQELATMGKAVQSLVK